MPREKWKDRLVFGPASSYIDACGREVWFDSKVRLRCQVGHSNQKRIENKQETSIVPRLGTLFSADTYTFPSYGGLVTRIGQPCCDANRSTQSPNSLGSTRVDLVEHSDPYSSSSSSLPSPTSSSANYEGQNFLTPVSVLAS